MSRAITPLGIEIRERSRRMAEEQHREALLGLVDRQDETIRRMRRNLKRLTVGFFLAMASAFALLAAEFSRALP